MADAFSNFTQGYKFGGDIVDNARAQQTQNKLAQLAQGAYSAPSAERGGYIAQAIGLDPNAGMQLDQGLNKLDDAKTQRIVQAAKLLTTAPQNQRAGLYQQLKPQLASLGFSSLPDQYDPTVEQTAQSIATAYAPKTDTPAEVTAWNTMTKGFSPDEQSQALRVKYGLTPRAGLDQVFDAGPNGVVTINRANATSQQVAAPGASAPIASAPSGNFGSIFASLAQQFPDATMTSGTRTPAHNSEVGGVPNSQHLAGTASDWTVPANRKPAFRAWLAQNGLQGIDEGDHIHVQQPKGSQPAGTGGQLTKPREAPISSAPSVSTMTPAEVAQLGLPAGTVAQRDSNGKVDIISKPTAAQDKITAAQFAKLPQVNNVKAGLTRIDAALKNLSGGIANTGPLDQYAMQYTPSGQELEAAIGGIQNSMLALTRVPGVGSQSDLEAKIAGLQYPSLKLDPEVNKRNLMQLRNFVADLEAQATGGAGSAGQSAPASPTPSQPAASGDFSNLWN